LSLISNSTGPRTRNSQRDLQSSSPASVDAASPNWLAFAKNATLVLLGVQLFFSAHLPFFVAATGLDASWHSALGWLCSQNAQAGVDYIFTYGPFSYAVTEGFVPELFWHAYVWRIALGLANALIFVLLAKQMRSFAASAGFLVLINLLPLGIDGRSELAMLSLGLLLCRESRWQVPGLVFAAVLFAAFSMIKQTYVYLAAGVLVLVCFELCRQRKYLRAFTVLALFPACFLAEWTLLGQQPGNLPQYFHAMGQVVGGYNEAMSASGPGRDVVLAISIALLYAGAVATCGFKAITRPQAFSGLCILGLGLLIDWKHGFVRQDLHVMYFFNPAILMAFILPLVIKPERRILLYRTLLGTAFGLSIAAFYIATGEARDMRPSLDTVVKRSKAQYDQVLHPHADYSRLLQAQAEQQQSWDVPAIRARTAGRTVDLIGNEQGVLLLNQLNWHPRPVMQSYSAYTQYLLAANGDFYRGVSAPDFVLWNPSPIDGRMPTLEDSSAMLEILFRYKPVLAERLWILLERTTSAERTRPSGTVVLEKLMQPGEVVPLEQYPGRYQTISLEMEPSLLRKVRSAAYRPPAIRINLKLADGTDRRFRIIPAIAREEFLLNPLCESTSDFLTLYQNEPGQRVVSLAMDAGNRTFGLAGPVKLTIREYPSLVSEQINPTDAIEWGQTLFAALCPMFKSVPFKVQSPGTLAGRQNDHRVLRVIPEGEVRFSQSSKDRRITGKFGIERAAYEDGRADGVRFAIDHVDPAGKSTRLWQRELDPESQAADRGEQSFDVALPADHEGADRQGAESRGVVVLRTSNLPGRRAVRTWSYWTEVELGN
jgi:hypothetical protein